jgi:hypothetical protein
VSTMNRALAVAVSALWVCACSDKPQVPFAPAGAEYKTKMDFARLERRFPLTRRDLERLNPKNLQTLSQEEIDQIYARLTAGPIPDGPYEGTFFFSSGGGLDRLGEVLGGLKGKLVDVKLGLLERVGVLMWEGKVFYRDERLLRNMIQNRPSVRLMLQKLDVDPAKLGTIEVGSDKRWLLFPARLYCGQSLLDGRRESIIIDYMFSDELPGYQAGIDRLGGRDGLQIRDEIRMVRPGFYLGRAYMNKVFALNFTLLNRDVEAKGREAFQKAGRIEEDCYVGTQRLLASN